MTEKWYNLSENKRIIFKIIVVLILIIITTTILAMGAETKNPAPASYTIYVYDNGSAKIDIGSVNEIIQTHEDLEINGVTYKAGTVILPGNGNEIYYEYPQRDSLN